MLENIHLSDGVNAYPYHPVIMLITSNIQSLSFHNLVNLHLMDDRLVIALLERYAEKELQVMMVIEIAQPVTIVNYRIILSAYIHAHKENINPQKV